MRQLATMRTVGALRPIKGADGLQQTPLDFSSLGQPLFYRCIRIVTRHHVVKERKEWTDDQNDARKLVSRKERRFKQNPKKR